MKTKKLLRNLLQAVVVLIAAVIFVGMGFWLIDGRSPQAFIVSHSLKKSTMETYAMRKAETTGCGIVAPNYPMLYQYTAKDAHPLMLQLYRQLLERFPARRIIIAGDSAGGGFTLALTQEMRADSIELPSHLILISPWVDVTGGDDALQEHDTFLDNEVLRHVGADWAAELDTHDPIVSPLYGDMQGLPPTDLFTGTWEVFYTDIQKTYDKMNAAGVNVHLHAKYKMGHVYPLWPCPEGKEAREDIAEIIALTSNT